MPNVKNPRSRYSPRTAARRCPASGGTRAPIAGMPRVPSAVPRCGRRRLPGESEDEALARSIEVLADEPVDDAVDPLVVAPVGLAADALEHEPGALRMDLGPLVEPVHLELEPVVAKIEDQVTLEEACGAVGEAPSAEVRMDGERAEVRDPAAAVWRPGAPQPPPPGGGLHPEAA